MNTSKERTAKKRPLMFTPQKEFEVWKSIIHLKTKLEMQHKKWENASRLLGSAYEEAYKRHTSVLKQRDRQSELRAEIMWGVVSALTTGVLGGLGELLAKKTSREDYMDVFYGGVEDAIQNAAGTAITVKKMSKASSSSSVSTRPLSFQNDIIIALNQQWLVIMEYIYGIEQQLFEIDPSQRSSLESFDALQTKLNKHLRKIANKEKEKMKIFTDPDQPSFSSLVKKMEIYIWGLWWLEFIYKDPYVRSEFTGAAVDRRMIELGVAQKARIKIDWDNKDYENTNYLTRQHHLPEAIRIGHWFKEHVETQESKKGYHM